uniref:Protein kinase domain-containing protein n=1 Tax=Pyramimonas obovata TaxID=1411642 RepID=A0A7S0MS34_9CHLO|mmetsp:Transcript_12195/g.25600  ORF Transcript_12195/g.25600 Transcript_12195/m.25600 type:complete len:485 (+) Transcript_12195:365-1819(+)|eukprot:CAMPEP_0118932302 /NCGR_PEP_ID=MMETSP1169-20130426/9812_1 /TAXON_ID=36882 /ORGANISM="Pyramimonas obovata, Strain CCMP722" /LENGTH=484 /DNA_ID=CAMNT_0006874941 /DNA_START=319 /DNA_END=1773 /DNA_ORIENTATION=-
MPSEVLAPLPAGDAFQSQRVHGGATFKSVNFGERAWLNKTAATLSPPRKDPMTNWPVEATGLRRVSEDEELSVHDMPSNDSKMNDNWSNYNIIHEIMPRDHTLDASIRAGHNQLSAKDIELGEKLGEGAFATTYVATVLKDLKLAKKGDIVCVKILRDGSTEDQAYHEVVNLRQVQYLGEHENVVKVLGSNLTQVPYFIVMEFVSGWSLKDEIALRGPPPLSMVQRWTIHILRGIRHLHEVKLLHRDLKSGNVMLQVTEEHSAQADPDKTSLTCPFKSSRQQGFAEGYKPVAKIVDFGETKNISLLTPLTKEVGTWKWMAPEVMGLEERIEGSYHKGTVRYGTPADIYSLGMVIFEMVSGTEPFKKYATMQAAFAVSTGKRPSFRDIPKAKAILEFLIRSCWDGEPARRPSLEDIFYYAKLINTEYCTDWLPAEGAPEGASVYDMMVPQCPEECCAAASLKSVKFADFVELVYLQENGPPISAA